MNGAYLSNNLVEVLQNRAIQQPDKIAYTFLDGGGREAGSLTFSELHAKAQLVAVNLQHRAKPGDRALLVYPQGLEYIVALFGCLYAGVIPVPVYPPRANRDLGRVLSIANDCQAALVLTIHGFSRQFQAMPASLGRQMPFQLLETDAIVPSNSHAVDGWQKPEIASETIAFLQYTSGSTATPKGVMVSHGNVMHNLGTIEEVLGLTAESVFVSWLPLYHDMGLIGGVFLTPYTAGRCILMSPADFIQQPARWLEALSRYRGTVTAAPNFAYDLCARKISAEQLEKLDLSSWSAAINGAEPVRPDTIRRFVETFEPCGMRRSTLRAAYGLAEGTLLVTAFGGEDATVLKSFDAASLQRDVGVEVSPSQENSRVLVSCGGGSSDQQIAIVNPATLIPCPPGRVGEIWIKSPSVAQGYWNKPNVTQATFQAYTADTGSGPFLRTGDLGFLYQGQLYVTGRSKDLIIVNGRNHYPQDIEFTAAQSHPALRPGCGAAFSVNGDDAERIVVVYEISRSHVHGLDLDRVAACIRQAVAQEHELEVHTVAFLKPASIPKTSSGKIQRTLCRVKFLSGNLNWLEKAKAIPIAAASPAETSHASAVDDQPMQFSLFYFSSNEAEFRNHKYRLLLEGARFADEHDFAAVWVPERHFHPFGGLYPNPSVLASALAVTTKRVRIRAGSVVLPLHHPIRVAEEWSVVDNLSHGRVDLAFARGWNPNDFVLAPANYSESLKVLYESMGVVRKLWRGDSIPVSNGKGQETQVNIYPLPCQPELNVWLTCTGGVERFIEAGTAGVNILTALLFQSVDELEEKLASYRQARHRAGHNPGTGHVTLMMHTFLGTDQGEVKSKVRGPFIEYLRTSVDLWQNGSVDLKNMTQDRAREVLNLAFERYYQTSGLFGTPETCLETIQRLKQAGVDEIACLIDFGVETKDALKGLHALHWLQEKTRAITAMGKPSQAAPAAAGAANGVDGAVNDQTPEPIVTIPRPSQTTDRSQQVEYPPDHQVLVGLVRQTITGVIASVTQLQPEEIISSNHFLTLGINSLKGAEILDVVQKQFDLKLSHSLLFEFPTVEKLAEVLVREHEEHLLGQMLRRADQQKGPPEDIRRLEKSFVVEGGPA